jgi:hypothetical protein
MIYRHKQTGFVMIAFFVIVFFVFVDLLVLGIVFWFHMLSASMMGLVIVLMFLMAVLGGLFSTMTIIIDKGWLSWHFALGFWKRSAQLDQITSCKAVKIPWYYGWGIRRIPGGWLYRVSGRSGVEIRLENGSALHLGSDEPDKLLKALEKAKTMNCSGLQAARDRA